MNDLISIVVPIYNVEKYLSACLDSIINQTYQNIEIILVDDGSFDNSGEIADQYALKDSRIKVIHKKNGGLSDARNCGIGLSTGKYITFIDSDDDVTLDYIEYLYNLIKKYNTKMSIASFNLIRNGKVLNTGSSYSEVKLKTSECLDRLLCSEGFNVSACGKMYDISLFNTIEFPLNKLCEDNGTTYKLIMECENIAYGNEPKYNYYTRDNSIMTKKFDVKKLDLIELVDQMADDVLAVYPELKESVEKRQIEARFSILIQILSSDSSYFLKEKEEIKRYLKNSRSALLKNKKLTKREKFAFYALLLGENFFKFSWKVYQKIRF